jgi:uncharacterized protein
MRALALASDQVNDSSVNLETLEAFLKSDRAPADSMMLSDLDGFLTGIAIGPELVPPSEWLPAIWGGETPQFLDQDEAGAIADAVMARYHEIALQIADEKCEPILWIDRDGTPLAFAWADGFLQAIALRPDAWEKLFRSEHVAFLLPIVALSSDEEGRSLLGLSHVQDDRIMDEATELMPTCVIKIAAFWRGKGGGVPTSLTTGLRPDLTQTVLKVGRNDPCPCGSGKKFKKCCGKSV